MGPSKTSRENDAEAYIRDFPGATVGDVRKALGLKDRKQADRIITTLQRKGRVRRSGEVGPRSRVRSLEVVRGR